MNDGVDQKIVIIIIIKYCYNNYVTLLVERNTGYVK